MGAGDQNCSVVGMGAIRPGLATVTLGTAGLAILAAGAYAVTGNAAADAPTSQREDFFGQGYPLTNIAIPTSRHTQGNFGRYHAGWIANFTE